MKNFLFTILSEPPAKFTGTIFSYPNDTICKFPKYIITISSTFPYNILIPFYFYKILFLWVKV